MTYQSLFDPSRPNVGKIYRDLALENKETSIECGDLTHEIMKSLCEDINEAVEMDPFRGESFYIHVHEKKDLLMPRAINRTLRHIQMRPYPEDDTLVFWVDPRSNIIKFCWCLPHFTEMENMLNNPDLYNHEMLEQIKAWMRNDLTVFGFRKDLEGNWEADPNHQDITMKSKSIGVDILKPELFLS